MIGYEHGGVGEILAQLFPEGKIKMSERAQVAEKIVEWTQLTDRPKPASEIPFTLQSMLEKTIATYQDVLTPLKGRKPLQ